MSSRFLSKATTAMAPYVPGEQPRDRRYIKLNTNECPYPPSPRVSQAIEAFDSGDLRLYPDPEAMEFTKALAKANGLDPAQVLACGGSDEALAFAFMAFFDKGDKVYFPDITYGFYPVYAQLFGLEAVTIPLGEDFTLRPEDYFGLDSHMFIANPNAPTGIALERDQIEAILRENPNRLVVVDEAYADFCPGVTAIPLIERYDNLLVVQTFSKSRALAGMRLGAAFGNAALIEGLNRIKYSFNPYNLDRVSLVAGITAVEDREYFQGLIAKITATRQRVSGKLAALGFTVLPSKSNFLFVRHPSLPGGELYRKLRDKGILTRYFNKERIDDYLRVTVGTDSEMDAFLQAVEELL